MRCPYCGDRRTAVLKTVYRGHNSYRHRRCVHCGSRFSTQERPVRWSRVELKWPGPQPSRKGWRRGRTAALRGKCEVESCGADFKQAGIRRHVDHIVPARLIRRLRAGNPDRRENLQCICGTCHGYKLQADHKLCLGDKLGYLEIRSQNELTGFGFAKDYDAVLTVHTEAGEQRFALEYERSPKPMRYYRDVAASLSREAHVNQVLYLVCNYDLLQFISGFFRNYRCHVVFGLVKDWHSQLLEMPVSCSSATRRSRFRETLDHAAAYVEAAMISG